MHIRVTSADPSKAVFVGIASQTDARQYLAGVGHLVVPNWVGGVAAGRVTAGGAPSKAPADAGIWAVQSAGPGTQTAVWRPQDGRWSVVVMNADRTPGVTVTADGGVTVPGVGWIAAALIAVAIILLAGATALVGIPIVRASR